MSRRNKISVHQFHSGTAVGDAVTNSMFFVQSMLQGFGFQSEIFAEHVDPALDQQIRRLDELRTAASDILLIHHSMGHDAFAHLAALRCRKFLVYHNITPPEFLDGGDPTTQAYAIKGYSQLSLFRDIVEAAIAVSPFNARQLHSRGFTSVAVIPLLRDFAAIRSSPHARTPYHDEAAVMRLLFVGRIVPHKCQHELVDFVDQVRSIGGVPLELVLVGHFDEAARYKSRLDELIRRKRLGGNVTLTGRVTDQQLFGWYRAANAYVSFSEHEGFGVPLVEAMAFDLPVIAYASSAVPDTLGKAGIAIADKDPATVLDALHRVHADRSYRREIIRSQRARLLRFSRERLESDLRDWLIGIGACDGGGAEPDGRARADGARPPPRTHYVVEGPYETSYSLAIVNRNIALALNERTGCSASIEPAEGVEGYSVDPIAAGSLPPEIQDLVRSAPVTPERIVTIRNTYPTRPNGLLGDFRLVHLAWEESSIPGPVAGLINLHVDGILAPSRYSGRVIRNSGVRVPIAVVGHGIDHFGAQPPVIRSRSRWGPVTGPLPFTFLHISSGLARKGIEELITAYCLAFSRHDPVLLVIKTFPNSTNTIDDWVARLTGAAEYSPSIQVISEDLDSYQIDFLYQVSDAVVLPTRGEGFNLPAAEGLARGLPVIVTRHSGHLDFCNDENSFLIDCTYELSDSHFKIPNSYWARPSIEQLVRAMKTLYRAGRLPQATEAARAARGQQDAARLRWHTVAERIDEFVDYLDKRPVMMRKLRLGWISTYNAQCGIAAHSEHLLEFFDRDAFEITIIADDQERLGPDPDNVVRLWKKYAGGLERVRDFLVTNGFDAAFFQHNFQFYDFAEFANILLLLPAAGIETFVALHRTKDLENQDPRVPHQRLIQGLHACTRVFVHSIDDVNRLREWGVTENVVLLAHGVIDRAPLNADGVRGLLGLSDFSPVIGSFGFLLPGKGLIELIHSFALISRAYPTAYLLMVNADYPIPESQEERERCLAVIGLLELEDRVRLVSEFLDIEETLLLLSACDAIVYPYQRSEESASGAVRLGLAAGRPVVTTPLPIFAELREIVCQLRGTGPAEIAEGIISLLQDDDRKAQILQRQRDWVRANSWAAQAARISNIIRGCFEETHGVELRVPAPAPSAPPRRATTPEQAGASWSPGDDLTAALKLLDRKAVTAPSPDQIADPSPSREIPARRRLSPIGQGRSLFRVGASKLPRFNRRNAERKLLSLADRARDARDWSSAARYYREALDLKPDDPLVWVQYGHALKESGNLPDAENAYRNSLELDADVADTHLQLGHALKIQGRKIEASVAYLRALALDPALHHAARELRGLGWTAGRIQLTLRRERSGAT